ncbi:protein phosphatase 1K, mitochondrial [Anguilla rostrata]|uniref:protein phosphatase 1K, mitochondrial n=1 Tax=Anguilla rostrata TaxID=7938 RepID=UPI0030CD2C20
MSAVAAITLFRSKIFPIGTRVLWTARALLVKPRPFHCGPAPRLSNSRFDPDGSGTPTTWDAFGIWDDRIDEPILLPPSIKYGTPIPKVSLARVGGASLLGRRKENEDRLQASQITDAVLYFAVFDGHGGPQAADFCHKYMETYIRDLVAKEEDLELVLRKAFLEVDKALERQLHVSADASLQTAGSTATVALLRDGIELAVGSVGDSRAILSRKGKAVKLTVDHTAERKDERERIKSSRLFPPPQLHHAHDAFLALTTDGINFIMNSQEICDVISQCHDPKEAAQRITEQALQYGSEDNSTALVVPFGAWGKHKSSHLTSTFSRSFTSSGRWA